MRNKGEIIRNIHARIEAFNGHLLYVKRDERVLLIKILGITRWVFKCNKNPLVYSELTHAFIHVRPSCEPLAAREKEEVWRQREKARRRKYGNTWKMRYVRKNSVMHFPVYCSLCLKWDFHQCAAFKPRQKRKSGCRLAGQPLAMRERNTGGIRKKRRKKKRAR